MGVPSTTATAAGAAAGLSLAAGAAACCPLPQAASKMVIAATADQRVHCVLRNCVIWILYTRKKAAMADMADAPGGRSLAGTGRSLQLSMRFLQNPAVGHPGGADASIANAWMSDFNRSSMAADTRTCRPRWVLENGCGPPRPLHGRHADDSRPRW